jgi:hypothetical protein
MAARKTGKYRFTTNKNNQLVLQMELEQEQYVYPGSLVSSSSWRDATIEDLLEIKLT